MVLVVKNPPTKQETWVQDMGLGRSPGVGNGNPLQYSCLGNPMDRRAWQAIVHGQQRVRHDGAHMHTHTHPHTHTHVIII